MDRVGYESYRGDDLPDDGRAVSTILRRPEPRVGVRRFWWSVIAFLVVFWGGIALLVIRALFGA